jgi:hypothetical protein
MLDLCHSLYFFLTLELQAIQFAKVLNLSNCDTGKDYVQSGTVANPFRLLSFEFFSIFPRRIRRRVRFVPVFLIYCPSSLNPHPFDLTLPRAPGEASAVAWSGSVGPVLEGTPERQRSPEGAEHLRPHTYFLATTVNDKHGHWLPWRG